MITPRKLFGGLGNLMFKEAYLYAQVREKKIPDVYVQNPKYFNKYAKEIKQMYSQNIPAQTDMVAIHVRRGDYVNNLFYVDLTETGYYDRAMLLFPNQKFLVFSDNIDFCKNELFNGNEFEFAEGNEVADFNLMASCIGHIVANSSFSWWSAFIAPYTKKVVAPIEWHTDGVERTVCPPEWVKV
jgi:hypothetical protein